MADQTYQQVRDVIDLTRRFHRRMSDFYEAHERFQTDERASQLLDQMRRYDTAIDAVLGSYDDRDVVLDTWLQFVPTHELETALKEAELGDDITVDDLIGTALEVDRQLISMHKTLAESATAPRVQELFQSLVQLEETQDSRLAWAGLTAREY